MNNPAPPPVSNATPPAQQNGRMVPQSELDYNLILTQPDWGKNTVSPGLRDALSERVTLGFTQDEEGTITQHDTDIDGWERLSYLTKDLRLGNLSTGEMREAEEDLNLAGDCLSLEYPKSFQYLLRRVAGKIELSQSKEGFLRKGQNTIRQESVNETIEPKRGTFGFGGGNKQ